MGTPSIELFGLPVARLTADEALRAIEDIVGRGRGKVFYVNAHTLNLAASDPAFHEVLSSADLLLNDGSGVALAARMKGDRFPENLNGSDMNPRILELAAKRDWKVYFLGGAPGVAETAAEKLMARLGGVEVVGCHDGYFPRSEDRAIAAGIEASGADVVMVAMGNPLQELWLTANLDATGAWLGVGVGAFFDFASERVPRSPAWMRRFGIEWVYRLLMEPARMWRRYVVGNPLFLLRAAREAWRTRRERA